MISPVRLISVMDTSQKLKAAKEEVRQALKVPFCEKVWSWWRLLCFIYQQPDFLLWHLYSQRNKEWRSPLYNVIWKRKK